MPGFSAGARQAPAPSGFAVDKKMPARSTCLTFCLVLIAAPYGAAATRSLLLGDAARGRDTLRSEQCLTCHSISGEGARLAPDLGRIAGRNFSPATLASRMWNHAPAMWDAMAKRKSKTPTLSEQQAADLFAHFYSVAYFEKPGNEERGRQAFRELQCASCHGVTASIRGGVQPVAEWRGLLNPIEMARQMWNHSREMQTAFRTAGIERPQLTSQSLADLLAFARRHARPAPAIFAPDSAERGRRVFRSAGCESCHAGADSLLQRPTRYSLTDFSTALWNHSLAEPLRPVALSYEDMRGLVGYLLSIQFFEERGEPSRGRKVFEQKRCASCHEGSTRIAPDLSKRASEITSYHMVAALWKHGPTMRQRMQAAGISWPRLSPEEMTDLLAYLHGQRLKPRPAAQPAPPQRAKTAASHWPSTPQRIPAVLRDNQRRLRIAIQTHR